MQELYGEMPHECVTVRGPDAPGAVHPVQRRGRLGWRGAGPNWDALYQLCGSACEGAGFRRRPDLQPNNDHV